MSNGRVPRNPDWCSYCVLDKTKPCSHHIGKDGEKVEYNGHDVYEPSSWVNHVVGTNYKGWDGRPYICFGYDPRSGFWMRSTDDQPMRETNVSERAIDRSFREIH